MKPLSWLRNEQVLLAQESHALQTTTKRLKNGIVCRIELIYLNIYRNNRVYISLVSTFRKSFLRLIFRVFFKNVTMKRKAHLASLPRLSARMRVPKRVPIQYRGFDASVKMNLNISQNKGV